MTGRSATAGRLQADRTRGLETALRARSSPRGRKVRRALSRPERPRSNHLPSLVVVTDFASIYVGTLEDLGRPPSAADGWDGNPGDVPPSLSELYRVAGLHPLNRFHHRLLLPDELERHDTRVVFAVENQETIVWGYDISEPSDDPLVWQGHPSATGDAIDAWYSEDMTLSSFITAMWRWLAAPDEAH